GLLLRSQAAPFVENQLLLLGAGLTLFRLGNGGDELRSASPVDQVTGWLARFVELPVLMGILIGGVDDWAFEKRIRHTLRFRVSTQPLASAILVELQTIALAPPADTICLISLICL